MDNATPITVRQLFAWRQLGLPMADADGWTAAAADRFLSDVQRLGGYSAAELYGEPPEAAADGLAAVMEG